MGRGADTTEAIGGAGRTNLWGMPPEALIVVDDPEHPLHDPDRSDGPSQVFVDDLVENGVLTPLVGEKGNGRILVIDGRQRTLGARLANPIRAKLGLEPIVLEVRTKDGRLLTDLDRIGMMISANEQRRPTTPMSRARMLQRFLEFGTRVLKDERGIAEDDTETDAKEIRETLLAKAQVRFGVSRESLLNWEKMLGCSAPVQKAYDANKINAQV